MRAGTLRTRVEFQRPVTAADAVGQRLPTWETVVKRRGSLVQRTGSESEGIAVQSTTRWELRVRYETALADMSTKWRVLSGGRTYDIDSVINQNSRNRELLIILIDVE